MKKYIISALLGIAFLGASAQPMMRPSGPENEFSAIEGTSAMSFNLPRTHDMSSRAGHGPAFYLFPDQKMDEKAGKAYIEELGLT